VKIEARNAEHVRRYEVYLDGVNVSDCVKEADDIAHEVVAIIRRPDGSLVRNQGRVLTAVVRGQVTIVSKVNEPSLVQ